MKLHTGMNKIQALEKSAKGLPTVFALPDYQFNPKFDGSTDDNNPDKIKHFSL